MRCLKSFCQRFLTEDGYEVVRFTTILYDEYVGFHRAILSLVSLYKVTQNAGVESSRYVCDLDSEICDQLQMADLRTMGLTFKFAQRAEVLVYPNGQLDSSSFLPALCHVKGMFISWYKHLGLLWQYIQQKLVYGSFSHALSMAQHVTWFHNALNGKSVFFLV